MASAINCLTTWEPNKPEICDKAVITLVSLLLCGDASTERHAACACANLMENSELHNRFVECSRMFCLIVDCELTGVF